MVFKIVKEVRDIKRLREILTVLFEEGFDFIIDEIKLKGKVPFTKRVKAKAEKKDHSMEKRLRLTLERLGPTFIKFGQVLSVRPDLVPKSYIKELEKLQDKVPALSYDIIKNQIKSELGKDIKDIFTSFDKKPIASASISQVHKATLKDGSVVAVKIQRPNARKTMEIDVEIMEYAAKLLEKHIPQIRKFNPIKIIEEFWNWTQKELDFNKEAMNIRRFARNFAGSKTVKIPRVYPMFTKEKILVMEFIEGIELHNVKQLKKKRINLKKVIDNGFEAILTQVFVHGFFHADPHPGNLIITNKKVAFVDFGIVGHFDDNLKSRSIELFYGIISNDSEAVVEAMKQLCDSQIDDVVELKNEISDVLEELQDTDIRKVKVSRALEEVMDLALSYGFKMPMPFVLFGKTIITLEGIALEYDPQFRIIDSSRPFIEKLMLQRYNPATQFSSLLKDMFKFRRFATEFPERASNALRKIEKGSIRVDIEDSDISRLSSKIARSGNRVAYSMLIAAFLIVGALTVNYGKPLLLNLPLLSFLSFFASLLLSLILLYSILREKNIIK